MSQNIPLSDQSRTQKFLRSGFFIPASGLTHGVSESGRGTVIHISQKQRRKNNLTLLRALGYKPNCLGQYYKRKVQILRLQARQIKKYCVRHGISVESYATYKSKKKEFVKFLEAMRSKYSNVVGRCTKSYYKRYENYGGRGIKCLLTFTEFEFLWHRDYAANMKKPSIDRINNDGSYTFENCRFIEMSENSRRRSKNSKSLYPNKGSIGSGE